MHLGKENDAMLEIWMPNKTLGVGWLLKSKLKYV